MAAAVSYDPQVQQVATVYARGFLQAAQRELGSEVAVWDAVEELEVLATQVFAHQPGMVARLSSSRASLADKVALLKKVLGDRVSSVVVRFLGVLCQHGRFDFLGPIVSQTRVLANQAAGIVPVVITSAVELPADVEERVTQSLAAKLGGKIALTKKIDPELLGGLQVRVGDTVFDGSVQGKLERVRRTAFERAAERIRAEFDRFVSVE
jgi:F-type H+-transporting ATPase subunit delta